MTELGARLGAFEDLLGLSEARLDAEACGEAKALLARVGRRRALPAGHTVVALAGATGSGKSSLFNALCGVGLSRVGVRRPTTDEPVACVWGGGDAARTLDWLEIPEPLRFRRRGAAAPGRAAAPDPAGLSGLVLLDLPDHDSCDAGHRAQVDRLVGLADAIVWVLDPEKYGDAWVHERYLRPLAGHADVMLVVLNQVDRLPDDAVPQCAQDVRRLLDEDGVAAGEHGEAGAQVLVTSALTGEGVAELREALEQMAREREVAGRRIRADLDLAVAKLRSSYVGHGAARLDEGARTRFLTRLGDAVGARAVGEAVARDFLRRTACVCAPRYRRRLGTRTCGRGGAVGRPAAQRAVVDEAVREVAAEAASGLPEPWMREVLGRAEEGGRRLASDLDEAVLRGRGEMGPVLPPRWWSVVGVAQWLLLCAVVAGAAAVVAKAAGAVACAWWVAGGPAGGGLLVAEGLSRCCLLLAGRSAVPRRHEAERRMRSVAEECGRTAVLAPVDAELWRYREAREHYGLALGG